MTKLRIRRQATPALLELIAERFRALGEPARLVILHALERGERSVSELAAVTRLSQGNLSKHLKQLHALGFLKRRREGAFVHYSLADANVLALCEIMCDRLEADVEAAQVLVKTR
jgi:DNA-binding transcriptional ArsR family regulator